MRRSTLQRLTGLGLIVAAAAGCAPNRADTGPHPVWPGPPAQPRVVHRQDLRGPDDFGGADLFEGIGRALAGTQPRRIIRPSTVALDGRGRLFVTDQEWQGIHVFRFGSAHSDFIDHVGEVYFVSPVGLAVVDDLIAVADSALKRVDLIQPDGTPVRRLEKPGGFGRPAGLAYSTARRELYVVDSAAHELCVFAPDGRFLRTIGGPGVDVGQFNFPTHVCVDDAGRLFVTDSLNFRVQAFDADGRYLFEIGRHGDASGHFGVPKGVAVDTFGHIYVVDSYFANVQVFDETGRFLLTVGSPGRGPGEFQVPTGLTIGRDNRIYVCDSHNERIQVLEYTGGPTDANP